MPLFPALVVSRLQVILIVVQFAVGVLSVSAAALGKVPVTDWDSLTASIAPVIFSGGYMCFHWHLIELIPIPPPASVPAGLAGFIACDLHPSRSRGFMFGTPGWTRTTILPVKDRVLMLSASPAVAGLLAF